MATREPANKQNAVRWFENCGEKEKKINKTSQKQKEYTRKNVNFVQKKSRKCEEEKNKVVFRSFY